MYYIIMYYIIIYWIILTIIGILSMWADKRKAQKQSWRISERVLIWVAFLGGSIGSLLGMYLFRHKTRHPKFVYGIPSIIVLQAVAVYFLSHYLPEW